MRNRATNDSSMKPIVYNYMNYRDFLRDSYEYAKQTEGMTLRDFARRAGFNTHTFLVNVIDQKRSLTVESAAKVSRAFNLTPEQRLFFELLVRFNNAERIEDKNDIYEMMRAAVPKSEIKRIGHEYYDIFRYAYILTVRELIGLPDFKPEPKWIAKKLHPHITATEAGKALETLLACGLVERDEQGKWRQSHADLTTGAEVKSLAVSLYHKQLLGLAAASIETTAAANRDVSSLTVNIARSDFDFIKRRTAEFRRELLEFLKGKRENTSGQFPSEPERAIYYLNIQFFNATEIPW